MELMPASIGAVGPALSRVLDGIYQRNRGAAARAVPSRASVSSAVSSLASRSTSRSAAASSLASSGPAFKEADSSRSRSPVSGVGADEALATN